MSKSIRYLLAGCLAAILLVGAFSGGMVVGWFLPHNNVVAAHSIRPQLLESWQSKPYP
jgi:hypothetical protein